MANVTASMAPPSTEASGPLEPGTRVEVRQRFDAGWSRGFEIDAVTEGGYRVRRTSDAAELPVEFSPHDVRPERRRDTWWY